MSDNQPDHDEAISQFASLTGVAPSEGRHYLEANQWDLAAAAAEYYTSLEEASNDPQPELGSAPETQATPAVPPQAPGGGRTLGGDHAPQPIPTTSQMADQPSSSSRAAPKKKFATLGDLGGGSSAGHAGHDHDDDDDDSDEEKQNFFAGGEKSGLAVKNPDDMKKKIIERAKKNLARPEDPSAPPQPTATNFTGTARTLGGDDTPSETIPDPTSSRSRAAPPVERILHFWSDGFSVDDGPLYRNDDPANAEILAHIRQGRAPMDILNVERSQEVDVKLDMHEEKYKPPKKKYRPFEGGGQRLGSPTPGDAISQPSASTTAAIPSTASGTSSTSSSGMDVDDSQPTVSLQIRLGDGTRLVSRFNTNHTIGDVYDFVRRASTASQAREFALMTTFPSAELKDLTKVLGDMSEFKRGGTVVQKWI
ncbi:MAG: hypothetical protein Q9183_003981 [Haloplaca sp. 2 TL-2023]